MAMTQQERNYAYSKVLMETVDELHRTKQIPVNADVLTQVN